MISGDVLQSGAGQARARQPLAKLTAVMFPPELSEPGVPAVHLREELINCQKSSKKGETRPDQVSRTKTTAQGRTWRGL